MGKIEIDIPKDLEQALDAAFPGEDKAAVVLRLLQAELSRSSDSESVSRNGQALVEMARRIRQTGRTFTDEEIKKARAEGRP